MEIICPLCRQPLQQAEKRWHCINRHSFDTARQGYTNLLPVQNKKSKSPGDSANMVAARHQFLQAGYYLPLANNINQLVISHLRQHSIRQACIIDAGCGEGYYTAALAAACSEADICGIDISKAAIVSAAKRNRQLLWFVANSNAIPAANHCSDILLSLFAPIQPDEFHRCLRADGLLLIAATGTNHLIELRELLYDEVHDSILDVSAAVGERFGLCSCIDVNFTIELNDNSTINNLLAMTPHYWRVSPQRKSLLTSLQQLSLTVDIQLYSFQPG